MENENLSAIDEAKKVRDELKFENDRREKLLAEEQKLQSERMLAGKSQLDAPVTPEDPAKKMADDIVNAFKRK
jgi:hypothetical protein